jgi:hypothetical protein
MLAKIVDNTTKLCSVAVGTDTEYYKSHGFAELDVEKAWDGNYYLAGYAPAQPKEEQLAKLDAQYNADKAELLTAYQTAQLYGDTDTMESLKADLTALDNQYDEDYERIVGGE